MGKFTISLTEKAAKKQRLKIHSTEPKGLFIWIGGCNVVDWTIGYRKGRGFIADKHYQTGNRWAYDLFRSLFDKDGFVTVTRFL